MKVEKRHLRVETYGKVRNRGPMTKVLIFAVGFLVFIIVLTIARELIIPESAIFPITGLSFEQGQQPNNRAQDTISRAGKSFGTLDFDISSLASDPIIKDLPKDAVILLKLGQNYYTLSGKSIGLGEPSSPDISISIPVSYIDEVSLGLCEVIRQANRNGDLQIETYLPKTSLMWKYKSMLKHQNCLGL